MTTPHVICHMLSTVNGKILSNNWGEEEIEVFGELYEKCHQSFDSQAWMCGRVTFEKDFTDGQKPLLAKPPQAIERKAFIGDNTATSFAIAIDTKGKLGWDDNHISGDHIIEVVTEEVSDEYLYYLQQKNISYIFAGKQDVDFKHALHQLYTLFAIKTILLEGGGHLNGSLLNEGLIDELSILLVPIADSTAKSTTAFELSEYLQQKGAASLKLTDVKKLESDVLWVRYIVSKNN